MGGQVKEDLSALIALKQDYVLELITLRSPILIIILASIVVGEASVILANSTFTDATCNGICDDTASVTPTGGTPHILTYGL